MPSSKESLLTQLVPVEDGFNLSQDTHGAIQIKITSFRQVRLFSFKHECSTGSIHTTPTPLLCSGLHAVLSALKVHKSSLTQETDC